ncbi:uncharacterized protein LOC117173506 [Belonocnema kinseyi]|uniref:uncharacterized protein LOC117173506 n=1 Tax=Belonocnema kinseyi TaxID=2817044 RepID=UPI00143DFB4F|nr:uncharacterized protein LOC117173506 [Belonocnema kinseyi]
MGRKCIVPGCISTGQAKSHRFPRNETVGQKWLTAIQSPLYNELIYEDFRKKKLVICCRHFKDNDYCEPNSEKKMLKYDSVPTLFLPKSHNMASDEIQMCEVEIEAEDAEILEAVSEVTAEIEIAINEFQEPVVDLEEVEEENLKISKAESFCISPNVSYVVERLCTSNIIKSSLTTPSRGRGVINAEDLNRTEDGIMRVESDVILEKEKADIADVHSSHPREIQEIIRATPSTSFSRNGKSGSGLKMKRKSLLGGASTVDLTPVAKVIHEHSSNARRMHYQTRLRFTRYDTRNKNSQGDVFEIHHTFTSSCPNHDNDHLSCSRVKVIKQD